MTGANRTAYGIASCSCPPVTRNRLRKMCGVREPTTVMLSTGPSMIVMITVSMISRNRSQPDMEAEWHEKVGASTVRLDLASFGDARQGREVVVSANIV